MMTPDEKLEWSYTQATHFLPSLGNRWLHVQSVVEMAKRISETFGKTEGKYLIAAAYVHDIGYAPELAILGFHPIDGAVFINKEIGDMRLASLVAHHTGAQSEAYLRGLSDKLSIFPQERSALADALTYYLNDEVSQHVID
jgi:HD superfamily phosphodiesterase